MNLNTFIHQLSVLAEDILSSRDAGTLYEQWRAGEEAGRQAEEFGRTHPERPASPEGGVLSALSRIRMAPERVKGFSELISEVHNHGLCRRCGGCVTFCSSMNYGAIAMKDGSPPVFSEKGNCIECGLCFSVCPENREGMEEVKQMVSWAAPFGRVLGSGVARMQDQGMRLQTSNGGALAGMLLHLHDSGHIDGVLTAAPSVTSSHEFTMVLTREAILSSAGAFVEPALGLACPNGSSAPAENTAWTKPQARFAFVGTPCQILALRKMESLGIMPAEKMVYKFGMFCSGRDLSCSFCSDYSAEYADLSFGSFDTRNGWSTLIARTSLGQAVLAGAGKSMLEVKRNGASSAALQNVWEQARRKKKAAIETRSRSLVMELQQFNRP
jgi:coenzyme F420 hydrogenase subunit beta